MARMSRPRGAWRAFGYGHMKGRSWPASSEGPVPSRRPGAGALGMRAHVCVIPCAGTGHSKLSQHKTRANSRAGGALHGRLVSCRTCMRRKSALNGAWVVGPLLHHRASELECVLMVHVLLQHQPRLA
jgi:hypothetical protein